MRKHPRRQLAGIIGAPAARPVKEHIARGGPLRRGQRASHPSSRASAAGRGTARPSRSCAPLARCDGWEPCTYRLDPAVNWLPESLPVDFPHRARRLCFCHQGGEVVVLPAGGGFALTSHQRVT